MHFATSDRLITSNIKQRAQRHFNDSRTITFCRTDKFFAYLMIVQWIGGIIAAVSLSPRTWDGTHSSLHIHVWTAIFLGAAIILFPLYLAICYPGRTVTRHVIAAAQMLISGLLVHLSGGRIETHFHIFGCLALLSFYGNWPVIVTAAAVTAADHFIRGTYFPLSVYGVSYASIWRSVEHSSWVVFESACLVWACRVTRNEVAQFAKKRAELEDVNNKFQESTDALMSAQSAIREREERMRAILDTAADIIITLNDNGGIVSANRAAETLLGYDTAEMVGKNIYLFLTTESQPILQQTILNLKDHIQNNVGVSHCSIMALTKGGHTPTLEVAISEMFIGSEHSYTAIMRDVTERQIMEIQLLQAQKLESIGQLAAGIAHEINTPIQFVGDNTRFLQDEFSNIKALLEGCSKFIENLPHDARTTETSVIEMDEILKKVDSNYLCDEIPKALQQSLDGISRVTRIVRAMKEFSHPGTTDKQMIDLNKAIESTIVISTNEWKYVADVEMNFDKSLPLVPCLPGELNQVILNLLVNAAHALAEIKDRGPTGKGRITVSTAKIGDLVEIRLQDTGPGIPKHIAHKIFDPFFTTKVVGKGTGQGLAISRSIIVTKHGGTIEFESESGKGTTFIIRLPLRVDSPKTKTASETVMIT